MQRKFNSNNVLQQKSKKPTAPTERDWDRELPDALVDVTHFRIGIFLNH